METRRLLLSIALIIVVTTSFALTNTFAGLAYVGGTDPLSVSVVRFVLPPIALVIFIRASGARLSLPRYDGRIAVVLGIITVIYNFALLSAIEILPVSLAVLIFFLFPLLTSLILAVMGWERLTATTIVAAFVAFGGLALALGVDSENLSLVGVGYAAISAIGLAIVSAVSSRVIRSGDSRPVTLYIVSTAAIAFIAVSTIRGELNLPQTGDGWLGFVGNSVFYTVGIIGYFVAISLIGAAKTTLFSYVEPFLTMAAAYLFLGQTLTPLQLTGAVIVVGALTSAALLGLRSRAVRAGAAPARPDQSK